VVLETHAFLTVIDAVHLLHFGGRHPASARAGQLMYMQVEVIFTGTGRPEAMLRLCIVDTKQRDLPCTNPVDVALFVAHLCAHSQWIWIGIQKCTLLTINALTCI
jgi:hypothetical protein